MCCLALQVVYSLYPLAKSEVSGEKSYDKGNYANNQKAPGSCVWVREVVLTQGGATSCPQGKQPQGWPLGCYQGPWEEEEGSRAVSLPPLSYHAKLTTGSLTSVFWARYG